MMSQRKTVPTSIEAEVLTQSRRRCCICFGLHKDDSVHRGQIAYLDGDPANSNLGNLVFLCCNHHDEYDSASSQSKGLTAPEIRRYRELLNIHNQRLISKCELRLEIDRDYDQYSGGELDSLLRAVATLSGVGDGVRVVNRRCGSVVVTVKLSVEQAQVVQAAAKRGELAEHGVVKAQLLEDERLESNSFNSDPSRRRGTPETRWSVVLNARDGPATPQGSHALGELCQTYAQTLYRIARKQGQNEEDAWDSVQSFLSKLLSGEAKLGFAEPDRGRFRSFLWTRFSRYLIDEYRHSTTKKAGGGLKRHSLNLTRPTGGSSFEPVDASTPERTYQKAYAYDTFSAAFSAIEEAWTAQGKGDQFVHVREYLVEACEGAKAEKLAHSLGVSQGRARAIAMEMRKEFGRTLRGIVAQTLSEPNEDDIAGELSWILEGLGL